MPRYSSIECTLPHAFRCVSSASIRNCSLPRPRICRAMRRISGEKLTPEKLSVMLFCAPLLLWKVWLSSKFWGAGVLA